MDEGRDGWAQEGLRLDAILRRVGMRRSGKLAVIDLVKRAVVTYLDLAPPADSINPANCAGCALHGVTVRS